MGSCNNERHFRNIGNIEKMDPALDSIISAGAQPEIIAEGFQWSEGPVWIESKKMLLFSDVPTDTVYKWTEEEGKQLYLTPSGYTGTVKRGGEMGSNGLTLDKNGNLVLCQQGDRQIGKMAAPIDKPETKYIVIAGNYNLKKFNSPNDLVYDNKGELFFTDPPYGLEKLMNDPKKELPFQGVFKVTLSGQVVLLTDTLTRPNGIAFLPGEKTLLIANSDHIKPHWYAYEMGDDGLLKNGRIFYSAAGYDTTLKGLPDGIKVDKRGNVFGAGPGGIWIFNKDGKLLGKIRVPDATSNCAFSPDEKTLYITNKMYVLRLIMRK
jgi:gluconolactonase